MANDCRVSVATKLCIVYLRFVMTSIDENKGYNSLIVEVYKIVNTSVRVEGIVIYVEVV